MKSLKSILSDNYKMSNKNPYRRHKKDEADIFDFLELIRNWEKIVGPRLCQNTIPLKLNHKSLTVLTSHPVFAQQLSYMEQVIIKKIEETFPQLDRQIKKIFFQADNKHFLEKKKTVTQKEVKKEEFKKKWHKHSPEYKKIMQEAESLLGEIQDEELKTSLKSIYLQLSDSE